MSDGEVKVEARDSPLRCAVCHGGIEREAPPCAGCGTVTHADCRVEARGCPTFGCVEAPRRIVITAPRPRPAGVGLVSVIGAALGLMAFTLGCLAGLSFRPFEPRLGLLAVCATAFAFMGGWAGAGTAALVQRAAPRAGLLAHWPLALQLLFVLFQVGLAALLSDSLFVRYSTWVTIF